jgi:hypothetical protein
VDAADVEPHFHFRREGIAAGAASAAHSEQGAHPGNRRLPPRQPEDYVFSALTAFTDSEVRFEPISERPEEARLGLLKVPMEAKFIINDGQHRRAAIIEALEQKPELGAKRSPSSSSSILASIAASRCSPT